MNGKINLLIIEPNALIRRTLHRYFEHSEVIRVMGKAHDAKIAKEKTSAIMPDFIIFDSDDDYENDLVYLKSIVGGFFIPIIFFSSKDIEEVGQKALELGSLDWGYIKKPMSNLVDETIRLFPNFDQKLKELILSSKMRIDRLVVAPRSPKLSLKSKNIFEKREPYSWPKKNFCEPIICIGASTGGTTALLKIFSELPTNMPGIIAVIHMPVQFTGSFAARLNQLCAINVVEAQQHLEIKRGQAVIAAGDRHLEIRNFENTIFTVFGGDNPVNGHCPSVDVLFKSVAQKLGSSSVGVILTGMGRDGADGLKEIYSSGGLTIAQDESSSVVFGMPKCAIENGSVKEVLSLSEIPRRLISLFT